MVDLSRSTPKPEKTAKDSLVELIDKLHSTDDNLMELKGVIESIEIESAIDCALIYANSLLKLMSCPECGGNVENGVCQTSTCKGRLL